jgi:hypothetical protein
MKAILNRATAVPTVRRSFGYSLYWGVLFSATAVYAQGPPSNCRWGWIDAGQTKQGWVCNSPTGQSNCRWGGSMPLKPNRVGSATRALGGPAADGGGLMPIKPNRVGSATRLVSRSPSPNRIPICPRPRARQYTN